VTQNIGQLLVSSILSDNAVPVNKVHFVAIPFPDMTKALQDHQVDAIWAPEPFITESEENAGAIPLADSDQGTTENLPISGYMVTASWLKKNPNTAAAFRRALLRAQAIAATDPEAIQKGMEAFAGVPAKTASIEATPQFPTQSNAALLARLEALMLHFNMINQQYSVSQMISK
jgi:NitT/TauT family transport system substrate-binding protein